MRKKSIYEVAKAECDATCEFCEIDGHGNHAPRCPVQLEREIHDLKIESQRILNSVFEASRLLPNAVSYIKQLEEYISGLKYLQITHEDQTAISRVAAKLSERKTVHTWLNEAGIPDTEETGKPMCLLRRLAVALGRAASHQRNEPMTTDLHQAVADRRKKAVELMLNERKRQDEKWGKQDHDMPTWLAILHEESGELAQAILHRKFGGPEAFGELGEAVQVAAVAIQIIEYLLERGNNGQP